MQDDYEIDSEVHCCKCGHSPLHNRDCTNWCENDKMSKNILVIEVTTVHTIEVDADNYIVKEYSNEKELVADLVSYRFTTLPVIGNGVEIKDTEVLEWYIQ